MKELNKFLVPREVKEIAQAEQEYRLEIDERITPHRGHTLFKVNLSTGEVSKASYSSDLVWCIKRSTFVPENPTLIKEDGYTYVSALSKESVKKKLLKKDNGSRIDHTQKFVNL